MTNDDNDANIILRRLYSRGILGGRHLPESLALSWIKHLGKREGAMEREAYEHAIKQGFIRRFPHTGEKHVSIDQERIKEIVAILNREGNA